jgi:glycosyltransferase involved in cell wall biosynthesis/GT2 family glycosyltransferase
MPRFSIVVPAFNAQATLAETLDAVLGQEWDDWECIVVDDGSDDGTGAIAAGYATRDPRIHMVSQTNAGSAGAYNSGVAQASGDFVVVCSADDLLLPQHLAEMSRAIDAAGYDIYTSNGFYLRSDGSRDVVYEPREIPDSLTLADLIRNCFYSVGAAYRRGLFDAVGGYRLDVYGEDYDFWLRAMAKGARHRYLSTPLSLHRVGPAQKSADLETVYRSDIRLVTDLRRSMRLSAEEEAAVEECVGIRQRYLARMKGRPAVQRLRTRCMDLATVVLGRDRINRLSRRMRASLRPVAAGSTPTSPRTPRRQGRRGRLRVLVIPSWYPSPDQPTAGIFIRQQVDALARHADAAVLYVREADRELTPRVAVEGTTTVARAQLEMPPTSHTVPGRARAIATNLFNKLYRYPRTGLAAFESLQDSWGTPDIVHVQALWPAAMIACAIKRRHGIPYVVTEHSEEYLAASERRLVRTPGAVPILLRPLARGASRTIAVSRFLADRLVELGLAVDPLVIPNLVPVTTPSPMPSTERHMIAHVSIMGPAKNLGALLQAVDRLRGRRTDFLLRLIGDGESRAGLEQLAAAHGLDDVVQFTGRVPAEEIHELLADSAFTVVSSTHETFSVVAAESLMCGRPVLSTRCGGPEEFITPQVGRLIDAGSVDALVEGIDWMLDHFQEFDPEALHHYAAERFSPEVVAGRIMQTYREVLGDA